MSRQRLVTVLGLTGAGLGLVAGVVQTFLGSAIPEWTGDKLAYAALGIVTIGLFALALLATLRQRDQRLSLLARAACAVGMVGPGLLCLTTVGRLAYPPAVLLTAAGVLAVERWRETFSAIAASWGRVLVSLLGGCAMLAVAAGPGLITLVGGLAGLVLVVVPWRHRHSRAPARRLP